MLNSRASGDVATGPAPAELTADPPAEQRARELAALLEVARNLNSTLEVEPLLDLILDQLAGVIDYFSAGIFLARADMLETVAGRDKTSRARQRPYIGRRRPLEQVAPIWQAMRGGEPLLISDVYRDDHPLIDAWRAAAAGFRPDLIRTWLGVPLTVRGQLSGYLALTRETPDSFSGREVDLAVAFAGHAAIAIANARLLAESERRAREQAALLEVARTVNSTLELEPLLDLILNQLRRVIDYRSAGVMVIRDGEVETIAMRDTEDRLRDRSQIGLRLPLAIVEPLWLSIRHGEPVVIGDVRRRDDPLARAWRQTAVDDPYSERSPVRAWMAAPLSVKGAVFGCLALTRETPDSFTEHDTRTVRAFAGHAATAIENARLHGESEQHTRELATLLAVSRNVASTLELTPLMGVILDQLGEVIAYSGASLLRLEDDALTILDSRTGRQPDASTGMRFPLDHDSLIWQAFLRHEPIVIEDVRGDEPLAAAYRTAIGPALESAPFRDVRSWLAAPLVIQDRVTGLLTMSLTEPNYFDAGHTRLARAFADQAALAMENARLLAESKQQTRELSTLLEVSSKLASTLELKPLLGVILDQLKLVADYSSASILSLDGDQAVQLDYRWPGIPADQVPEQRFPLSRFSPIWEIVRRREPVIVSDVDDGSAAARAYRQVVGERLMTSLSYVRSWMAVPLTLNDRVIGMITLAKDEPGFYTHRHAALATAIADQAAVAIENARLLAQTEQRARELTALLGVAASLSSTIQLEPLLDVVLNQIKVVAEYDSALIVSQEAAGDRILRRRAPTASGFDHDRSFRVGPATAARMAEAFSRREAVIIDDCLGDDPLAREFRAATGVPSTTPAFNHIRSWMTVPLALTDRVIGQIVLTDRRPGYYTAHHAELVTAIAAQAAVAIENARLYQQAAALAALEERQRLARELYDSVSQALFGIALGARTAQRRLERDPARVRESLDYVVALAGTAQAEMRALIFELRPESLEQEGLVACLTRQAAATRARHEIAVELKLCEEPEAPLAVKEVLYRIAQEAMHNTVKHARASRIDLCLEEIPGHLMLEVADNGAGFDTAHDYAGHLGLTSMRERVAAIRATMLIDSAPGQGTRIRVLVAP